MQAKYPDGTLRPVDLSGQLYQAYVFEGDAFGRYPDQPVAGNADGTFEIPDVPEGTFLLRSGPKGFAEFKQHEDHEIHDVFPALGRPDATPVTVPTPLVFDLTNLASWGGLDWLVVDCFETATEAYRPPIVLDAGATTIDAGFDWGDIAHVQSATPSASPYLLASTDHLSVSRLAVTENDTSLVHVLTQLATVPAPDQAPANTSVVSGSFVDVSATEQLGFALDVDAIRGALAPGISVDGWRQIGWTGPGPVSLGFGPTLFQIDAAYSAPASGSIAYGDPFDASWPKHLETQVFAKRQDASGFVPTFVAFAETGPLTGAAELEPLAGLGDVTLGGLQIAGQTLSIAPDAKVVIDAHGPSGTATLWLYQVIEGPGGTFTLPVALATGSLPFELPQDLFQSGTHYMVQLEVAVTDGDRTRVSGIASDTFTLVGQ